MTPEDNLSSVVSDWADEMAEINRLEAQRQERRIEFDGAEGLMARKQVSRFTAMGDYHE